MNIVRPISHPLHLLRKLPQVELEVTNRVTNVDKSRSGIEAAPDDLDLAVIEILTRRRRRRRVVQRASLRGVNRHNPPGDRRSSAQQGVYASSEDLRVTLIDIWAGPEFLRVVEEAFNCVAHAAELDELLEEGFDLLLGHLELFTNLDLQVQVAGGDACPGLPFCGGDAGDDDYVEGGVVATVVAFQIMPF